MPFQELAAGLRGFYACKPGDRPFGAGERNMQNTIFALGRVLAAPLFIISGFSKFMNVAGILGSTGTKNFMALIGGGTAPTWLGYLIASVELIGGLMILVGFKTKCAAIALLLFTIVATVFGHQFWIDPSQQTQFLKNLVIMGAFLMLIANGAGPYSFDNRSGAN
jgi:putative oxidoreductase